MLTVKVSYLACSTSNFSETKNDLQDKNAHQTISLKVAFDSGETLKHLSSLCGKR